MPLTPAQCRAARALLNWSQEELVKWSGITKKTIADFERGETNPRPQTITSIIAALQAGGVELLNGAGPGVRLKLPISSVLSDANISPPGTMTPEQSRAARGWLRWSQDELASRAKVALRTVAAFERGGQLPRPKSVTVMRQAIEDAGVQLLFDGEGRATGIARGDTSGELPRARGSTTGGCPGS